MAKKIWKFTSNVIIGFLILLIVLLGFVIISSKLSGEDPKAFGYQFKTVLSRSMEPTFKSGSIIAVKKVEDKTSLQKGDIVTFISGPNKLVTHRITEVLKADKLTLYRTKGDNNKAVDLEPLYSNNVVSIYTGFTIPYAGYFVTYAQDTFLLIIPSVMLLMLLFQVFRKIKETNSDPPKKSV